MLLVCHLMIGNSDVDSTVYSPCWQKRSMKKTKFYHHRCAQFKCVGSIPAHMAGTRCDVGPSFFLYPSAFHDTFYQCFSPSFCCQGLPGMIVIIIWYEPIPLGKYSNEPFTMSKHAKLKKPGYVILINMVL